MNFEFPNASEPLNMVLLSAVDLKRVMNGDIQNCSEFLNNFIRSRIGLDEVKNLNFSELDKMIKISQIGIDYYN